MSRTAERARVAALTRHRHPDDPDLRNAHRDLRAARLEDQIKRVASELPPFTPEQVDRLTGLLRGGAK